MIKDTVKPKGRPTFRLYDENMELKAEWTVDNLVVDAGLEYIAGKMDDTVDPTAMSHMAIGTNNTAPAAGNTALGTELARVGLSDTVASGPDVLYTATFGPGTGTGSLHEAGIFNDPSAGTMLARVTFGTQTKNAGDTLTVSWTVTITG